MFKVVADNVRFVIDAIINRQGGNDAIAQWVHQVKISVMETLINAGTENPSCYVVFDNTNGNVYCSEWYTETDLHCNDLSDFTVYEIESRRGYHRVTDNTDLFK